MSGHPCSDDAKAIAQSYGETAVVIFYLDDRTKCFGYTSHGIDVPRHNAAKRFARAVFVDVMAERIVRSTVDESDKLEAAAGAEESGRIAELERQLDQVKMAYHSSERQKAHWQQQLMIARQGGAAGAAAPSTQLLDQIADKSAEVLRLQKIYFQSRWRMDLENSKAAERELRELLKKRNPAAEEPDEPAQQELAL